MVATINCLSLKMNTDNILPVAKRHLLLANAVVWGVPGVKILLPVSGPTLPSGRRGISSGWPWGLFAYWQASFGCSGAS